MQDDIIEHADLKDSVTSSFGALLKSCDQNKVVVDVPQVRAEKQDLIDRWEQLLLTVKEVTTRTASTSKAVTEFEQRMVPVEELIVETERKLDEEAPFSWDVLEMEDYVNKLNVSNEFVCDLQITLRHRFINVADTLFLLQVRFTPIPAGL